MNETHSNNEISVVAIDRIEVVRGRGEPRIAITSLDISNLSSSVKEFLDKIGNVISDIPHSVGEFSLDEFEITAEIGTEGKLSLLGNGLSANANGGLKFIFRRKN